MSRNRSLRSLAATVWGPFADLAAIALWTLLVALLTLTAGWSRLQFYVLLLLGVIAYVQVTAPWSR